MKKHSVVFLIWCTFGIGLSACSRSSVMDVDDWGDTEAVIVDRNVAPNDVLGTWHGFIPCPGCIGYTYDLTLMDDYKFEERVIYEDRPGEPVTRIGTWSVTDGIIELSGDEADQKRFSLAAAGELRMLDLAGKPINEEQRAQYSLKRNTAFEEEETRFWEDSRKVGVDFVATGHNPGWLLEIDREKEILFKTRPKEDVVLSAPTPVSSMQGNTTRYSVTTDAGALIVELTEQICKDAMSGKERPYTVKITANNKVYTGCGLYLGEK